MSVWFQSCGLLLAGSTILDKFSLDTYWSLWKIYLEGPNTMDSLKNSGLPTSPEYLDDVLYSSNFRTAGFSWTTHLVTHWQDSSAYSCKKMCLCSFQFLFVQIPAWFSVASYIVHIFDSCFRTTTTTDTIHYPICLYFPTWWTRQRVVPILLVSSLDGLILYTLDTQKLATLLVPPLCHGLRISLPSNDLSLKVMSLGLVQNSLTLGLVVGRSIPPEWIGLSLSLSAIPISAPSATGFPFFTNGDPLIGLSETPIGALSVLKRTVLFQWADHP